MPQFLPCLRVQREKLSLVEPAENEIPRRRQQTRLRHAIELVLPPDVTGRRIHCLDRATPWLVAWPRGSASEKVCARQIGSFAGEELALEIPDGKIKQLRDRTVGGRIPVGAALRTRRNHRPL